MPSNEDCLGGHAVMVCGYDDTAQHWIVRNSWGSHWGDNGYFYLPYPYLTNNQYASDLWVITTLKPIMFLYLHLTLRLFHQNRQRIVPYF